MFAHAIVVRSDTNLESSCCVLGYLLDVVHHDPRVEHDRVLLRLLGRPRLHLQDCAQGELVLVLPRGAARLDPIFHLELGTLGWAAACLPLFALAAACDWHRLGQRAGFALFAQLLWPVLLSTGTVPDNPYYEI